MNLRGNLNLRVHPTEIANDVNQPLASPAVDE
jgi:hypothetical protein